jgi:hypothetical protein
MSPQQLAALTALASPPGGAPDMDEVNAADMATHSGPAHNGGPTSYSPDMSDTSTRGSVPRSSSARWPTRPPALLLPPPVRPTNLGVTTSGPSPANDATFDAKLGSSSGHGSTG